MDALHARFEDLRLDRFVGDRAARFQDVLNALSFVRDERLRRFVGRLRRFFVRLRRRRGLRRLRLDDFRFGKGSGCCLRGRRDRLRRGDRCGWCCGGRCGRRWRGDSDLRGSGSSSPRPALTPRTMESRNRVIVRSPCQNAACSKDSVKCFSKIRATGGQGSVSKVAHDIHRSTMPALSE